MCGHEVVALWEGIIDKGAGRESGGVSDTEVRHEGGGVTGKGNSVTHGGGGVTGKGDNVTHERGGAAGVEALLHIMKKAEL